MSILHHQKKLFDNHNLLRNVIYSYHISRVSTKQKINYKGDSRNIYIVINVIYLNECIRFELNIGEKLWSFVSLYRSPSHTQDEFDKFTDNLELNLDLAVQNNP